MGFRNFGGEMERGDVWLFVICQFSKISSGLPQWTYTYVHTYYICCLPFGNREWTGMTLALRSHEANHMLAMGMSMSIWHFSPPLSKKQVKKWSWGKT
jgi:hypothetical protein